MEPRIPGRRFVNERRELRRDKFRQWGFSRTNQLLELFLVHQRSSNCTLFGTTIAPITITNRYH